MINFNHLSIILFILPVYQMLFYVVQLFTLRSKKNPVRRLLGFFMLLMLFYILINTSKYFGYSISYKYLFLIQLPVLLAIIPTLCRYVMRITNTSNKYNKSIALYYLPSFSVFALSVIAILLMDSDQKNIFLHSETLLKGNIFQISDFFTIIFILGNFVLITVQVILSSVQYKQIILHIKAIRKKNNASFPWLELSWLHFTFISVIAFVIINVTMNFINPEYNAVWAKVFNVGILITSGLAGYFSYKQDNLYNEVIGLTADKKSSDTSSVSESNFIPVQQDNNLVTLSDEETKEIITKLQYYLVKDKPFLDRKLRIADVSRAIGISKRKLSYVINREMEKNFYAIINKHRVLEAKVMLKKPQYKIYNLEAIAEMVGFQSKSSFNACFKQITGVTPSDFRKKNNSLINGNNQ